MTTKIDPLDGEAMRQRAIRVLQEAITDQRDKVEKQTIRLREMENMLDMAMGNKPRHDGLPIDKQYMDNTIDEYGGCLDF